jgi:hypothetical protein
MTLKDDCYISACQAIESVSQIIPSPIAEDYQGIVAHEVLQRIWSVLEDQIGTVQEKLLNDLTLVRSELSSAREREAVLKETIQQQAKELDELRATLTDG